jgi:tetratricopeptide (TPR) repeat protein
VIFIPIGLILTLIIAILTRCGGQSANEVHTEHEAAGLNRGLRYYVGGEYQMALAEFNMLIISDAEFGDAYNGRGLTYIELGQYEQAVSDFTQAIQLMPNWAGGYNNRGTAYVSLGRNDQALLDYNQAIELDPYFAKAFFNRGLLFLDQGEYKLAVVDFDQAILYTPEESISTQNVLATQGAGSLQAGAPTPNPFDSMLAEMEAMADLNSTYADLPDSYAYRGMANYYLGNTIQAVEDLEQALALGLDPDEQNWASAILDTIR